MLFKTNLPTVNKIKPAGGPLADPDNIWVKLTRCFLPSKDVGFGMIVALVLAISLNLGESLNNNLAHTPPMGWSSWGRFRCNVNCKKFPRECISEWLFREMAYRMVTDGYLSAGYEYLLIDDCWLAKSRDENGNLQPDQFRFPSGIRNLSDYVHSLGLKFGIYEDYGLKTCAGYPGILPQTMRRDAETFARWGIDYLKIDGCYSDSINMPMGFAKLGDCLMATGRPIVYSCSWPTYMTEIGISPNYTAAEYMCNLWRNYIDVQDSWRSVRSIMDYFAEHQEEFTPHAGPGHWNDPDMLIVGSFGLSYEQAKIQMAIWAILAGPLIMSHDLRVTHPEFRQILLNPRVISVNQDPLGIQGKRIYMNRRRRYEVWTKPLLPAYGQMTSWAIAIVNLNDAGEPSSIQFPLRFTKISKEFRLYSFTDLFDVYDCVEVTGTGVLLTRIPPLGVKIFKAELRISGAGGDEQWKKVQP